MVFVWYDEDDGAAARSGVDIQQRRECPNPKAWHELSSNFIQEPLGGALFALGPTWNKAEADACLLGITHAHAELPGHRTAIRINC